MLVEDDQAVATGMAAALDDKMLVDLCESAEAALRKLERTHYHVVCADYGLPGMNGLDLLERIAKGANPPRGLLVTGSEEYFRISKRRGYYVLKKPFDPERFVTIVEYLANLAAMRRTVNQMVNDSSSERR